MPPKRSYKTRSQHAAWILNFLETQKKKRIRLTRAKDLKAEARKEGMSPTTFHELLKTLSWFVVRVENPEGRHGVFYGLSSKWRDQFIEDNRILHERVSKIHELQEAQKKEQLKSLMGVTIARFTDFVPFIVALSIKNEKKIKDLQDWLTGCFQWILLPYLFETIRACWNDSDVALEILEKG